MKSQHARTKNIAFRIAAIAGALASIGSPVGAAQAGRVASYANGNVVEIEKSVSESSRYIFDHSELREVAMRDGHGEFTYYPKSGRAELRQMIGSRIVSLTFSKTSAGRTLALREAKISQIKPLYNGGALDFDSDTVISVPTPESCPKEMVPGAGAVSTSLGVASKVPNLDECKDGNSAVKARETIDRLLAPNRTKASKAFACDASNQGSIISEPLQKYLKSASDLKFTCAQDDRSHYSPEIRTLVFGRDALEGSLNSRAVALFHELVHADGSFSEFKTQTVVNCCMEANSKTKSSCKILDVYNELKAENSDFVVNLKSSILEDKGLTTEKKFVALDEIRQLSSVEHMCSNRQVSKSAVDALLAAKKRMNGNSSEAEAKAFETNIIADYKDACIKSAVTAVATVPGTIPQAASPAAPDARAGEAAPVPTNTTYAPTITRVTDSKEIQALDKPLSTLSRGARYVGDRVASSIGIGTAYASSSTSVSLPRKNADGSSSTRLAGTTKDGDPILDIGGDVGVTATVAAPFGDKPQDPTVKFYNLKTGAPIVAPSAGALASSGGGATARPATKPGRISKDAFNNEAGTADGSSAGSAGGDSVAGDAPNAATLAAAGKPAASVARAPSASGLAKPDASVTPTNLKRIFARAQDKAAEINAHLDDLRALSMQVQYRCKWYPTDLKAAREKFSIDAFEGRSGNCESER